MEIKSWSKNHFVFDRGQGMAEKVVWYYFPRKISFDFDLNLLCAFRDKFEGIFHTWGWGILEWAGEEGVMLPLWCFPGGYMKEDRYSFCYILSVIIGRPQFIHISSTPFFVPEFCSMRSLEMRPRVKKIVSKYCVEKKIEKIMTTLEKYLTSNNLPLDR